MFKLRNVCISIKILAILNLMIVTHLKKLRAEQKACKSKLYKNETAEARFISQLG